MSFRDETFSGGVLVQASARSPIYVPGSDGWSINDDGSAEFNNVSLRGTLYVSNASGSYVRAVASGDNTVINLEPPTNALAAGDTYAPGYLLAEDTAPANVQSYLEISSPIGLRNNGAGGITPRAFLRLTSGTVTGTNDDQLFVHASTVDLFSDTVVMGDTNNSSVRHFNGAGFPVGEKGTFSGIVIGSGVTSLTSGVIALSASYVNAPVVVPVLTNTSGASAQWTARAVNITTTQFQILFTGPSSAGFTAGGRYVALDIL